MSKSLQTRFLVILGVLLASLFFALPVEKRINLGLDLKGGMHLILKVDTEKLDTNAKSDAVVRAIEILRNRIDSLGVGETVIQREGESSILVQLPGVTNREAALQMVGQVAQLNFHIVSDDANLMKEAMDGKNPAGFLLKYSKEKGEPLLVEEQPVLKGEAISDARVDFNSNGFGEPHISLTLSAEGAKKFADITRQYVGHRLAIVLDGEVKSAPNIREPILTGQAEISGQFSYDEASLLALTLRSGSLPAPMHVEEERTIGPLLGKDSINAGIMASAVGILGVFVFMAGYYLIGGIIADLALLLNFIMIVGILGLINVLMPGSQATLTLPGIAGIILTLGMAVDANVLINERIREEMETGRPLRTAVSNGFNRAFNAIFDSHITSLIAAFMLFQFGSGPIKGFAVTLTIGLVASLFTSIFVARTLFMFLLEMNWIKSLPMLRILHDTKIDFVSPRYFFIGLSAITIVAGSLFFFNKGESAYGIDFAGGQIQEYKFKDPIQADHLRKICQEAGVKDVIIQRFDKDPRTVILRTAEDTYDKLAKTLKEKMPENPAELLRIEKVGPVVGHALRQRALLAIICSLAGILVYVGFRFKHFDFAIAGVVALIHDVVVALALTVFLGRQVDLLVVTALLTIAGYSINDTIVTYDRIRENMQKSRKMSLPEVINLSINQTLSRTVLTTSVTLLTVVALFLFGGEVLNTFSLCLLIGFLCGAYSTVFIAAPLVLFWERKKV